MMISNSVMFFQWTIISVHIAIKSFKVKVGCLSGSTKIPPVRSHEFDIPGDEQSALVRAEPNDKAWSTGWVSSSKESRLLR